MSNDILRDFILSHAEEIDNNDFKSVYSKALDDYDPTSVIPRFTEILIDASINPLLYMDYVPACYAYKLNWSSAVIPNSVTHIDEYAFCDCRRLTSITIPNNVTSIGDYAFYGCRGLTTITIPDSVASIGYAAFRSCSGLTSITIPDSVTSIGDYAFCRCGGLKSVTIGNNVTSIGISAFSQCFGLTSIIIPNSVTKINNNAFYGCDNLKDITFNGTIKQWEAVSKGYAWDYNTNKYTIHCTDGELKV